jgi:hypothetical protein
MTHSAYNWQILPGHKLKIFCNHTGKTVTVLQLYQCQGLPIDHIARIAFAEWQESASDKPSGLLHIGHLLFICTLAAALWACIYIMIPA